MAGMMWLHIILVPEIPYDSLQVLQIAGEPTPKSPL